MSLKKMAMRMAIAFAAAKGYQAFQSRGGMRGVRDMLAQTQNASGRGGSGARSGGGLGGLMASLGGGGSSASGGGLGGLLGALGGGAGGMGASGVGASSLGRSGMGGGTGGASMGGMGGGLAGLLGGLAAMAGGGAAASAMPQDDDARLRMAEAGPQDEATAAAMIRAIGQAVRADGEIDAEERRILDELIGDADTDEDRRAVDRALSEPVNPEALARDVPRGHESEVYAAALTAIDPDHPGEKDFLRRFATALALEPAEISRLHEVADKRH